MEIGLAILLFVCMTALLYVVLSLKITRHVDLQIKEFYKTRIHADMQEFYREMEGYAALFENRIQRFRVLVERNEAVLRDADSRNAQPAVEAQASELEPVLPAVVSHDQGKKAKKKLPLKGKAAAKTKMPPPKISSVKKATPPLKPIPRPAAKFVAAVPLNEQRRMNEVPRAAVFHPAEETYVEGDDSAIAEELMKDLFLKDEVELSQNKSVKSETLSIALQNPAQSTPQSAESPGMASFFSRLGKAIEPVLFGEKTSTPVAAGTAIPSEITRTAPAPVANKSVPDFGEVLRRAEQIKAEKKAERERAEIQARAEFYAAGDSVVTGATSFSDTRIKAAIAAENEAALTKAAPEIRLAPPAPEAPRRNALVVKELDKHTVNFLIDSLVKDNGYRKQALRALTENNIPLDEIARLSKIDIGELELMRQLGRF
jgi:hypothetical protein